MDACFGYNQNLMSIENKMKPLSYKILHNPREKLIVPLIVNDEATILTLIKEATKQVTTRPSVEILEVREENPRLSLYKSTFLSIFPNILYKNIYFICMDDIHQWPIQCSRSYSYNSFRRSSDPV
ncbi:hypothetical protein CR513_28890, partial [Mucuna pruriens]